MINCKCANHVPLVTHSNLYLDNGIFNSDNLNDWQHSCMYLAFMISGVVDLLGHRRRLPAGTEQCFLALAFLVEGILLGFHLKGPDFEVCSGFV